MRKLALILSLFAASAAVASAQDVFDRLRDGDVSAVKALIEKRLRRSISGTTTAGLRFIMPLRPGMPPCRLSHRQGRGRRGRGRVPKSAFHRAAMNDRREAGEPGGAALEARDSYERTALVLCARERGGAATARILLEAGGGHRGRGQVRRRRPGIGGLEGQGRFCRPSSRQGRPGSGPRAGNGGRSSIWRLPQGLIVLRRLAGPDQDLKLVDPLRNGAPSHGRGRRLGCHHRPPSRKRIRSRPPGPLRLDAASLRRPGRPDRRRPDSHRKKGSSDARTAAGQTAYDVARERGAEAAAGLLAEAGADTSGVRFPVLEGDYLGQKLPPARRRLRSGWASSPRSGASTARPCFPRTETRFIGRRW